jgi:hypothetical protein
LPPIEGRCLSSVWMEARWRRRGKEAVKILDPERALASAGGEEDSAYGAVAEERSLFLLVKPRPRAYPFPAPRRSRGSARLRPNPGGSAGSVCLMHSAPDLEALRR